MSSPDPVLHLLAGPNGAGKSTLATRILLPATRLPFVNADVLAAERWPGEEERHGQAASALAAAERLALLRARRSFVTETVFSHESKVELVEQARDRGYLVYLHVVVVPVELTVARVAHRVAHAGHSVPEEKVRARYQRLWSLVARASLLADGVTFYDNSSASTPLRIVARMRSGRLDGPPRWPTWTPTELVELG